MREVNWSVSEVKLIVWNFIDNMKCTLQWGLPYIKGILYRSLAALVILVVNWTGLQKGIFGNDDVT